MKRYFLLLAIFIFAALGCSAAASKGNPSLNTGKPTGMAFKTPVITDYFPFAENRSVEYQGRGNEFAEKSVYVDYVKGNRMQLRVANGGTVLGQVVENRGGELRLLISKAEFYYRDDLTGVKNLKPEILIKEPIKKGTAWKLQDGSRRSITGVDISVSTPMGKYKALEITTKGKDSKTQDYYVKGIGLVKNAFIANGDEISSSLRSINKDARVEQQLRIYYPNFEKGLNMYVNHKVKLRTNENIKGYFEKYFKAAPGIHLANILGVKTKIKSLAYNYGKKYAHIDFSKELVPEMNAGTSFENMLLTCITNTLGSYYGTDRVYITIEGKPYSSGHILMKKYETFRVDYKSSEEYK